MTHCSSSRPLFLKTLFSVAAIKQQRAGMQKPSSSKGREKGRESDRVTQTYSWGRGWRPGLGWFIWKLAIGWVEERKNMWHPARHSAQERVSVVTTPCYTLTDPYTYTHQFSNVKLQNAESDQIYYGVKSDVKEIIVLSAFAVNKPKIAMHLKIKHKEMTWRGCVSSGETINDWAHPSCATGPDALSHCTPPILLNFNSIILFLFIYFFPQLIYFNVSGLSSITFFANSPVFFCSNHQCSQLHCIFCCIQTEEVVLNLICRAEVNINRSCHKDNCNPFFNCGCKFV